jgi:hypothetical protein
MMTTQHQAPEVTSGLREAIERDIRIAIWNAGKWQGKPDEVAHSLIRKAMAEPTMIRALDAATRATQPLSLTVDDNLAGKLNQAADDLVSGATIFSDRVHGLLCAAADRLRSRSGEQIAENANCSGDIDRSGLAQEVE